MSAAMIAGETKASGASRIVEDATGEDSGREPGASVKLRISTAA
jgi:hypothetical protein